MNEQKLRNLIQESKQRFDYYSELYQGIDPESLESKNQLERNVPLSSKEDLLNYFEDGNIDFGVEDIDEPIIARPTSGTTSSLSCFYRKRSEIESHSERVAEGIGHFFEGGTNKDRVVVATTFSLIPIMVKQFLDQDCMVTSSSPFDIEKTAKEIMVMDCNVLVASPAVSLKLSEKLEEHGYEGIDKYYIISSGLPEMTRKALKSLNPDSEIHAQYGLAETGILLYQCPHQESTNKYHFFDSRDEIYVEIVDEKGESVDDGEIGELVVTKFVEENPLIRYAVGDLFEKGEKCKCGKTELRFAGRKEDNFNVKGISIFKDRIEDALKDLNESINQYQVLIDEEKSGELPKPKIKLRVNKENSCSLKQIETTFSNNFELAEDYTWRKGVDAGIFSEVEAEEFDFEDRKFRRVIDKRYEE